MNSTYIRSFGIALIAMLMIVPVSASAAESGSFDEEDIVTSATKPTIAGEAEDVKYVRLVVRNDDGKTMFKKDVRVKDGEWKAKISKTLKKGEYELALYAGKTSRGDTLAEGTLTIESKSKKNDTSAAGKGTTLSVSSVPLLFGGTARANASIPVAYVKIVNTSTKESSIAGLTLVQNGTAPVTTITNFATSDDKGGSRTTVNAAFKKFESYVPLAATFAPGQMRIFTIKAVMSPEALSSLGTQLKLDVASIDTGAKVTGMFPIRGTTWTIGY